MTEAFRRIDGDIGRGLLLICDHAENTIPAEFNGLGLPEPELERHIAYDIGAAAVTETLAQELGVPAILSRFSRLLIDPNRGADDPTLVMRLSDGAIVPGNARIDQSEVARRTRRFWRPYHDAITAELDRGIEMGKPPAILSIHSFTPQWKEIVRMWQVTVLWDADPRLPKLLLGALHREQGIMVGENEPYSGALKGDCLYSHGTMRGLAHALIEIRQDLIASADGQDVWSARLGRIVGEVLSDSAAMRDLNRIAFYNDRENEEMQERRNGQEVA